MTLRRNNAKLPWGAGGSGVYNAPGGGGGRTVVLGGIVLALVLLAGYFVFSVCGGNDCDDLYCATARDIPAPEGFERVSRVFAYDPAKGQISGGQTADVSLDLSKQADEEGNLSFYRYVEETQAWEPLATAAVQPGGKQAIARVTEYPAEIAVLRRLSATGQVVAYLPKGRSLHNDAVGKVTLLHTLDFAPSADGTIGGEATVIQGTQKFDHYPVFSANAATKSDAIVTGILSSSASRANHVQQIVTKAQEANLKGVDIAYLDLKADQRSSFALFIGELAGALHRQNKRLTVTLPAPAWTNDRVDEGAYDWAAIGAAADLVKVTPFRDQSRYRLDMPKILQHLASAVDRGKLILTVSPYATESSSDGGISTMSLAQAMAIATRLGIQGDKLSTESNVQVVALNVDRTENLTGMQWDAQTATVGFTYKFNSQRVIWIENFFSIGFKLEYVSQYELGGLAVEDGSNDPYLGNIWTALGPYIATGQPTLMRPNPDDLLPRWEVSGGEKQGGERAGQNGVLSWFTPAQAGTHTVKLVLSDGVSQFESAVSVNIQPRERTPAPGTTPQASPTTVR